MSESLRDWLLFAVCVVAMWAAVWLVGWQLARTTVPRVDPYDPSLAVIYEGER